MQRNHMFRYLVQYAGKGQQDSVKRMYEINEENIILKTHADCQVIKSTLIEHDTNPFEQAHQLIICKDKICEKLIKKRNR